MNRFHRACCAGTEDVRSRSVMRERASMQPTDESQGGMSLAMAYVPSQRFENLYEANDGWHRGTIFADLDKPYEGGCCR